MPTQIREYADYVAHFHTNDDNGYLPGSGNVDYPPIIEALKEINYTGYLRPRYSTLEPDSRDNSASKHRVFATVGWVRILHRIFLTPKLEL